MVLHLSQNDKIIQEEIFSKSIEFEPAWIGTIVVDGYAMRALEIEKVCQVK